MRFLTAGESHGPSLTAIVEGVPAHLPLSADDINARLRARQVGYGRGARMRIERDEVSLTAGVRAGKTTGGPLALVIANLDHRNWAHVMDPAAGNEPRRRALHEARPGHADLAGGLKYEHADLRDVLERASARETAARVAVGAVALRLLEALGVRSAAFVRSLGGFEVADDFAWENMSAVEDSDLRVWDEALAAKMRARIDEAKRAGDTLGGVVEVQVHGLPVGLGSHVHWDRRLDGRLAAAVMSVPAIKAVEIGDGWQGAARLGSEVHDAIFHSKEDGFHRHSNRAGGLEGGMTNGQPLVLRAAMKPIATLMRPLPTVNVQNMQPADAARERSDTTAVAAASVVVEAMVAWVLADAITERFGGDTLGELQERLGAARRKENGRA